MIVAICCPGQSLMRRWTESTGKHDLLITVNAAANLMRSDWVCAADKSWYRGLLSPTVPPRRGYLVAPDARADALAFANGLEVLTWENVSLIHQHTTEGRPINWSVQAALCFAEQLGAREIFLYGADGIKSTTTVDASGYKGEDRTPDRWQREEHDLAYTIAMIQGRSTTVHRIDP